MTEPKKNQFRSSAPQLTVAEDRARLVKLLGRLLAEEWLARQQRATQPKTTTSR